MKKSTLIILPVVALGACNTVAIKPHTFDKNKTVYVDTNGEAMRMYLKTEMENRGYNVTVGNKTTVTKAILNDSGAKEGIISTSNTNGARYIVQVNENYVGDTMVIAGRPLCMFNGWKWVDFSVSISDNLTGKEILNWSGMGCKNYAKRKLNELLDTLEK